MSKVVAQLKLIYIDRPESLPNRKQTAKYQYFFKESHFVVNMFTVPLKLNDFRVAFTENETVFNHYSESEYNILGEALLNLNGAIFT